MGKTLSVIADELRYKLQQGERIRVGPGSLYLSEAKAFSSVFRVTQTKDGFFTITLKNR